MAWHDPNYANKLDLARILSSWQGTPLSLSLYGCELYQWFAEEAKQHYG